MLEGSNQNEHEISSENKHGSTGPSLKDDEKVSVIEHIKEIVKIALLVVVIVFPIRAFIAQPFVVSGDSMYPTFKHGEYLIVDQVGYRFQEPARGEVVVFRFSPDQRQFFIKRIIGLPGETVEVRNGRVRITPAGGGASFELDEPYVEQPSADSALAMLGEDEYFVMGDNRTVSLDSRREGPVTSDLIIGRALVRLLPLRSAEIWPGKYEYMQNMSIGEIVPLATFYK